MSKKNKTKFYRVAVAGQTTDGRKIEPQWLQEMAASYHQNTYGARVWVEHIRGHHPDSTFGAYGDVIALKTGTVEIDDEQRLALFAAIDPTKALIAMNQRRQKIYSSIEIDPDFAGKGKAYLVGLAVTDSPASLGTDMLEFSAKNHVLDGRKQRPENLFSSAMETVFDFNDEQENEQKKENASFMQDLINGLTAAFSAGSESATKNEQTKTPEKTTTPDPVSAPQDFSQFAKAMGESLEKLGAHFAEQVSGLREEVGDLKKSFNEEPDPTQPKRAIQTGGEFNDQHKQAENLTDC